MTASSIATVHVVFKTHLDIGFTDLARNVKRAYVEDFIPGAIRLSRDLEQAQGPERFVWTTGAWLIEDYLTHARPAAQADMERAIDEGHVVWHALPFTTHSEMMDAGLFAHGLSIAARLDARFGRHTVAAKMTDVPGHTVGIVPILAAAGVRYLHIGTNPGSATPQVPETFRWRAPGGSEVVVNYASSYGSNAADAVEVGGFDQALYVSLTNDNHGPPSRERITALFAGLAERYPDAEIRAGRLDDFAAPLWERRAELPVLTEEIGDSWIHGIASDPTQVRNFRTLQRLRTHWVEGGELTPGTEEHDTFASGLLLVPEHTWGMDLKRFLADYVSYPKAAFNAARAADVVDPADNPAALATFVAHAEPGPGGHLTYSGYEASWQEQRGYVDAAIAALDPGRALLARQALDDLLPHRRTAAGPSLEIGRAHRLGRFEVTFAGDGSIVGLVDGTGRRLAAPDHRLAAFSYVTYDEDDYARWFAGYHENMTENANWVVPDFGKPGMESAAVSHSSFRAQVASIGRETLAEEDVVTVELHCSAAAAEMCGAPRDLQLRYGFSRTADTVEVELSWFGKDAYRLPEASWLTFNPSVAEPERWTVDKLGTDVSPLAVVPGGNRNLHGAGSGIRYRGPDGSITLDSLDAAVIAPGSPRLLVFDNTLPDLAGGFHVNLHNNVWGTNFRMWFAEDALFRFRFVSK